MRQELKTETAKANTTPVPAIKAVVAQELVLGKVKVKCNHLTGRWEITFMDGERKGKVHIVKAAKINNATFKTHEVPHGCGGSIYEGTAIGDYVELPENFRADDAPATYSFMYFDREVGAFFSRLLGIDRFNDRRITSAKEMYLLPGCKAKFIN